MKDLLKRTWWRAILLSLVVLLLSGGIVYATYYGVSKTLAATVTVAEVVTLPSDVIGVYSDQAGTANVTSLNFGRVAAGWGFGYTSVTVYVKNRSNTVGAEPVKLFINVSEANFNYGYVYVNTVYNQTTGSWDYPSVLPGEIKPVTINLYVDSNAPVGSYNLTVVIEGKAATAPDVMPVMPPTIPVKPPPTDPAATELANIQSAVISMMVDNNKATLSSGQYSTNATKDMSKFPNPAGTYYVLYGCTVNGTPTTVVNYVATQNTSETYTCDQYGTVTQALK